MTLIDAKNAADAEFLGFLLALNDVLLGGQGLFHGGQPGRVGEAAPWGQRFHHLFHF